MTDAEKIIFLKKVYDGTQSDEVLLVYLSIAGQKILRKAYPFKTEVTVVPLEYEMLQIEIATYLLNKIGAEGEISHSENGISRSYESASVPNSMLRDVIPVVGVIE